MPIAMALCCYKDECMEPIFCYELIDGQLTSGYLNRAGYIRKAFSNEIVKYSEGRALSQKILFQLQIFFHYLMS